MTENTPNQNILPTDEQLVSCELCLKSVPATESDTSEIDDYVAYFCGLECYDIWKKQQAKSIPNESKNYL